MSATLGDLNIGSMYAGSHKIAEAWLGNVKVYGGSSPVDPFNPLGLPPYTIRILLTHMAETPTMGDSQTYVGEGRGRYTSGKIWDITYTNTNWAGLFTRYNRGSWEILGANATGVTKFNAFCQESTNLIACAAFDTRDGLEFGAMFASCTGMQGAPEFKFMESKNIELYVPHMFYNCHRADGVYDLYVQLSKHEIRERYHENTFYGCPSSDTQYIPQSWGGTMASSDDFEGGLG